VSTKCWEVQERSVLHDSSRPVAAGRNL